MNEVEKKLEKAIPEIARRLENALVLACPVDKGSLRLSIKVFPEDKGLRIWMNKTGKFVEFGTPPHTIEPTNKMALKFEMEGEEVIVKKVRHPGTRPNPFVRNTIQNDLRKIIIDELAKA